DGRLAGLAVANDQLALAAADRYHRIDGLQAGLHRLRHRLTSDNPRGNLLDDVGHLGVDRALAVDRRAQCVDHAAAQLGANRHFQNAAGGLHRIAFGDVAVFAQNNGTDRVTLEVQRETKGVVGKFEHFALHHVGQTVNTGDAVGYRNHGALGADVGRRAQTLDAALQQFADLG